MHRMKVSCDTSLLLLITHVDIKVPFLTLHGKKDMIIKPSCSEELLQKVCPKDSLFPSSPQAIC